MKLQKNMYIRTKCNDFCNEVAIRKIIEIAEEDNNSFYVDYYIIDILGDEQGKLQIEDVKKTSFNIIDLIEVGDYVNGYPVTEITNVNNKIYEVKVKKPNNRTGVWIENIKKNEDIKSVVTKEQFEQISYKLGE